MQIHGNKSLCRSWPPLVALLICLLCCRHGNLAAALCTSSSPHLKVAAALRGARCRRLATPADKGSGTFNFLLARHGQTTFNADNRFQGTLDQEPVLTEKGRRQAADLGKWLLSQADEQSIEAVFVSPLLRAKQTLDVIKTVVPDLPEAVVLHDLREIELYEWQGLTQPEVAASNPELFKVWKERAWEVRLGDDRPVVQDLWVRAASAWQRMREAFTAPNAGASALVVGHGTLGKALLSTSLGLPEQAFRHFNIRNGDVVEVGFPSDKGPSDLGVASWRKRHPDQTPWTSGIDERSSWESSPGAIDFDVEPA